MTRIHTYEIVLSHQLPFLPSNEQAIYVEGEYDEELNAYIQTNIDRITAGFHAHSLEFCYLPLYAKKHGSDLLRYHNPNADEKAGVACDFTTKDFVEVLFNGDVPEDLKPSIIIYKKYDSTPEEARFLAVSLERDAAEKVTGKSPLWKRILIIGNSPRRRWQSLFAEMPGSLSSVLHDPCASQGGAHYSLVNWHDDEYWSYMKEHGQLIAEIDLRIHQLQERGVDSLILKKILDSLVDDSRPLSRLTITHDLRIILNDYDDMEIRMEPINKAIFLLFLKHEEGIRLKELSDYRTELESLYTRLSHDDREKRRKSIDNLLDPTNNSINEKISRVRQAFLAKFEEDLACSYYIRGPRGEVKRILIDRAMVTWE